MQHTMFIVCVFHLSIYSSLTLFSYFPVSSMSLPVKEASTAVEWFNLSQDIRHRGFVERGAAQTILHNVRVLDVCAACCDYF